MKKITKKKTVSMKTTVDELISLGSRDLNSDEASQVAGGGLILSE